MYLVMCDKDEAFEVCFLDVQEVISKRICQNQTEKLIFQQERIY